LERMCNGIVCRSVAAARATAWRVKVLTEDDHCTMLDAEYKHLTCSATL
jgi:hypothetical protein